MFAPLTKTASTVERCEDALRRSILERQLQPGERLPPERRLAEQFGVNRVTVRSALARLSAAGLVESRQGSGYTVRDFVQHGGPALIPGVLALAEEDDVCGVIADLLLVRRHLAQAVLARLVSGPLDVEALGRFDAAVDAFEAALGDDEAVAEADLVVVSALIAATGSAVLALCLNPISAVVRELPRLRRAIYADPASNLVGWRALGVLLRSSSLRGDPDAVLSQVASLLAARDEAALGRLG